MVKQERFYTSDQPPTLRSQPSIDHGPRATAPPPSSAYPSKDELKHRRQTSEAPHMAVPFHMRTASMGHHRDLSTASTIYPIESPALTSPHPEDHMFRSGFGGPYPYPHPHSYPSKQHRLVAPQQQPPPPYFNPYHRQVMEQHEYDPAYSNLGSPGPLIAMSPRQGGIMQGFSGLTPFLNVSPYPDSADPGAGAANKRHITPDIMGPEAAKNKRMRLEEPDDSVFDIPVSEYSERVTQKEWSEDDTAELLALLESAEKHKWRYISDKMYNKSQRRIPSLACARKFKDMFGVPEASSTLDTSLFYVALRRGWGTIKSERTSAEQKQDEQRRRQSRSTD